MSTVAFAKGHGTENDFVVLPDLDGRLELTPAQVAAICDRRRGIGGDGLLRVVPGALAPVSTSAPWFMDYRNADGSIAEMCGNGVRVFAQYLREEGLADGESVDIATRAGLRTARFAPDGSITVDMGAPEVLGTSRTLLDGVELEGLAVSMGNPHLAIDVLRYGLSVAGLDLDDEPRYDRVLFPQGVNQELYEDSDPVDGHDAHIRMRVHERGVGETRSCGTGICAAAVAALARSGATAGSVVVDVPGGRLYTEVGSDRVLLTGPAVLVARGTMTLPAGS